MATWQQQTNAATRPRGLASILQAAAHVSPPENERACAASGATNFCSRDLPKIKEDNIFFSGPRHSINFNDGMGGSSYGCCRISCSTNA
jgi:hypothetical protein